MTKQYAPKSKKWAIIFIVMALGLSLVLSACTPKEPAAPPEAVKRDSVFVAFASIGNTLDAAFANATNVTIATNHIYDLIIAVDEDFNYEPAVATSWEQVDNKTFRFTIGDGFVFHNGDALKLEDVVYSIERLRDIPKCASIMNNVDKVEATGPKEVTITLVEPNSSTIRSLMGTAHVYNKAYCLNAGEEAFTSKPIGTGPYKLKNFVPGDKLELEAWEDYPFEKPQIKNLTFKVIEEVGNRYISIETGEAQFATISYRDMDRAESNEKVEVVSKKTTNTAFISMNNTKAPFDNRNVRLAMAYATDREALAEVQGGATIIYSMTPPMFSTFYESPNVPKYDLAKAKALLEQEGYSATNPLKFDAWIYGGNSTIMEAYQAGLKSIGVQMDIKNYEFGVFLEGMANGEYQMLAGSWNNITGDTLGSIENYWSGSFGSSNISFFENARCDELYDVAKAAPDEATLKAAAKEVQEIAAQEMPIIPTFSNMAIFAMDKELQGVRIYSSSVFSFRKASFK